MYELLELFVLVHDDVLHVAKLDLLLHSLLHSRNLVPYPLALLG